MDTPNTRITSPGYTSDLETLLKKYPDVDAALQNVKKAVVEHKEAREKGFIYSKDLCEQYFNLCRRDRESQKAANFLNLKEQEIAKRQQAFGSLNDSYAHSAIFIYLDLNDLENSKMSDVNDMLTAWPRIVDEMTAENNKQGNYCQRMKKCLEIANSNELLLDDAKRESIDLQGIREYVPLELEKTYALADSIRTLDKVMQQSGFAKELSLAAQLKSGNNSSQVLG